MEVLHKTARQPVNLPVAPGHNDDAAAGGADACQLAHELRLVRHVLTALQGPDQIKLAVGKGLLQCITHLNMRWCCSWMTGG